MKRFEQIVKSSARPHTRQSLADDLRRLGVEPGKTLAVHASLSAVGYVVGGAVSVILALEDVLGVEGTLAMPSHTTDLSDPAQWENPPVPEGWHQLIRDQMPTFHPDLTPTWGMGTVAELFRRQEGTLRSQHPQVSWAARGKHAQRITAGHTMEMAQGETSPLARLYELGAEVLLLGVDFSVNTSFHLSEYRCRHAQRRHCQRIVPCEIEGNVSWVSYDDINISNEDFAEIGAAFCAGCSSVRSEVVGGACSQLFAHREAVDFAVRWMDRNRPLV